MNLPRSCRRRQALGAAIALALLATQSAPAHAAGTYPDKPVRLVVAFAAGGLTDILARTLAQALSQRLGQPVVVENKTGAGGIIGTSLVAKAPADGYTLLLSTPAPLTAYLALYKRLPYDPRTDLRPVSDIAMARTVLAVNPSVPARTVAELIAYGKQNPGKLRMGSWGQGTLAHTIQAYMAKTYGIDIMHVPYKGESLMTTDLLAGQVNVTVGSVTMLQPYFASGKLHPLAVTGTNRAKRLPDVPTFAEAGYADPSYRVVSPMTLLVPARTPQAIVDQLGKEVSKLVNSEPLGAQIEAMGAEPVGSLPDQAEAGYKALLPVMLKLTADTGVTLD